MHLYARMGFGDKMTMYPLKSTKGTRRFANLEQFKELESEKNGMPFYFKDLRDNFENFKKKHKKDLLS